MIIDSILLPPKITLTSPNQWAPDTRTKIVSVKEALICLIGAFLSLSFKLVNFHQDASRGLQKRSSPE